MPAVWLRVLLLLLPPPSFCRRTDVTDGPRRPVLGRNVVGILGALVAAAAVADAVTAVVTDAAMVGEEFHRLGGRRGEQGRRGGCCRTRDAAKVGHRMAMTPPSLFGRGGCLQRGHDGTL